MKLLIEISSRIRRGQFPRLPDFKYSAHFNSYVYGGRALDPEEFNTAAGIVFAEHYRTQGFTFAPRVLSPDEIEAYEDSIVAEADQRKLVVAAAAKRAAEPAPADEEEPPAEETPASRFSLVDDEVFEGETKVAKILADGSIRAGYGHASLKPDIEAWLSEQ